MFNKCISDIFLLHLLQVSVRLSDNYVECSCKFYFQKGYLCRHAFAALHQCGVKHIPKAFVKPRWSKNAIAHHSFLGSSQLKDICEARDRKKLIRTRAWFQFNYCMNLAGEDEEKLDLVSSGIEVVQAALNKTSDNSNQIIGANRADKFISPVAESEIRVANPNVSRNKGCGSRIKSSREIGAETGKGRTCSRCKKAGHNARSCPLNKKSA